MIIRARDAEDVGECVRMLMAVWERDRYPLYLPDDVRAFVASDSELGAWVATDADGQVVGHVALHRRSWPAVMGVAVEALACEVDDIAVVARLMVAPAARRAGIGAALLTHATWNATNLGKLPILDVAAHFAAAVALYDEAGWERIGTAVFPMPSGPGVKEIIFRAPES